MSRYREALAEFLTQRPLPGIVAAAGEHDAPVLCVGGAIRDVLLSRPAADIDIAVGGDLDAFVELFARHCGPRPVAIGDPWRDTRRTKLGSVQVDLGAMLGDETEDLAARDFTVNAMALRLGEGQPPGDLLDPHRGADDLESRTIRMLSSQALADDPLRMLRAVRYLASLDGFRIDELTLSAIRSRTAAIDDVAAERVQSEWAHLLHGAGWADAVRLAVELGLGERTLGFAADLCGVDAWAGFATASSSAVDAEDLVVLRLAALLAGAPAGPQERVGAMLVDRRWPRRLAHNAARVAAWARELADDPETVAWALEDRRAAGNAALLARALISTPDDRGMARIVALETHARRAAEAPWVSGSDLREWGMGEGPELGDLLQRVARGQLERRWETAAEARAWARDRAIAVGSKGSA
jgi:tRNA nucleotidyltransferase/poly(A) polymerase